MSKITRSNLEKKDKRKEKQWKKAKEQTEVGDKASHTTGVLNPSYVDTHAVGILKSLS